MGKEYGLILDVKELTKEQLESIRCLAEEIYDREMEEDIFKATISAVFSWIALSIHNETEH